MTQFNTYDLKEIIEKKGSVLAFDLGIKKIGVAVGNNVLKTSRNLITFYSKNKNQRIEKIKQLVNEWQPVYLVLGLPLNQDLSANDTTKFCINTAKDIEKNINLPMLMFELVLFFHRFSTPLLTFVLAVHVQLLTLPYYFSIQ